MTRVKRKGTEAAIEAVSRRIREARNRAGMSQRALAQATGLDQGTISNVENARQGLAVSTLLLIAEAVGMHPASLLYDEASPAARRRLPAAWSPFLNTPAGESLTQAERDLLTSINWPPGIQPTVSLYQGFLGLLRTMAERDHG